MPSEASFLKHAELTQQALQVFNTIRVLDAPGPTKTSLSELVTLTVWSPLIYLSRKVLLLTLFVTQGNLNGFMPQFIAHPLFKEIVPAVCQSIDNYATAHPKVTIPDLRCK